MARRVKYGGGSRKGRPNKSKAQVRELIDSIGDMTEMIGKLFELGRGVFVEKKVNGEMTVVYEERPDPAAIKLLLEYRYGKPPQPLEYSGTLAMTYSAHVDDSGRVIVEKKDHEQPSVN